MGTSIRINAFKGEKTNDDEWNTLRQHFYENFDDFEDNKDFLDSGVIYCPYSMANIKSHIPESLNLKESDITINLYYEEREPDEVMNL